MQPDEVQTLVLRAPKGPAVAHLIADVPEKMGRAAAQLLRELSPSFGLAGTGDTCISVGFSFAGLEAMGVPEHYLRVFRRLAPAFESGAVRRSVLLGDSGASAPQNWHVAFRQDRAHLVVTWHGREESVGARAGDFANKWQGTFNVWIPPCLKGKRLGAPPGEKGEWAHFRFRDGVSKVWIEGQIPSVPPAPDSTKHAPGALLLGHINDAGFNPFALSQAPHKVRSFFRDSSFGILRPMAQDVAAFDQQIDHWIKALGAKVKFDVTADFVKAKLCGRWPNGMPMRPGEVKQREALAMALDLATDGHGEGCPFGSHVRRMRAAPDQTGRVFERALQRRGVPFGPPEWEALHSVDGVPPLPAGNVPRGLIGQFFCASIEDQFEHLLGQWAARPPPEAEPGDVALDPLMGPHDDPDAAMAVPLQGYPTQRLQGFSAWTTTLGTMYAWHPSRSSWMALLNDDFVPEESEGPWL